MTNNYEKLLSRFKYLLYVYIIMHDNGVRKPFSKVNLRDNTLIDIVGIDYNNLIVRLQDKNIITRVTNWSHYPTIDDPTGETYKYSINVNNYKKELLNIIFQTDASAKIFEWINSSDKVQCHLPIIPFCNRNIVGVKTKTLKAGEVVSYDVRPFRFHSLFPVYGQYLNADEYKKFNKYQKKYYTIAHHLAKRIRIEKSQAFEIDNELIPKRFYTVAYVEELCNILLQYLDLPIKQNELDILTDIRLTNQQYKDADDDISYKLSKIISYDSLFLFTFAPYTVKKVIDPNDTEKIEIYKAIFRNDIIEHSPILKMLKKEAQIIRQYNGIARISPHIDFKINKKSFTISVSGRQWNAECDVPSNNRDNVFNKEGIDGNFDLHSAIFAVTRLMNKGVFDANWDIKNELLNSYHYTKEDGTELTRQDLKSLMMRLFFKKSSNDMLRLYKDSFWLDSYLKKNKEEEIEEKKITKYPKKKPQPPRLSDDMLLQINKDIEDMIGKTAPYYYNIFLIESIIEMRVIRRFLEKGKKIHNVYDCFYYSLAEYPNEANGDTNKEVIDIINSSAMSVYRELNEYLEQGRFWGMKTVRDMINEMDNS